jgi:hypothetical protein
MVRAPIWVAGLLALTGCGDDRPWQFDAAESVRELPLLQEVPIVRMTREEFAAQAAADADQIDDATLRYYADSYGRLGFFDRDLDLRPVFAGSSSDWVGATYSPWAKQITLVGDVGDDVLVHETVHAIQDQHFDLTAYDDNDSSDGFLARRAFVEGDATLAQYRFYGEYLARPTHRLDGFDWLVVFDGWRGFADDTLANADYPVMFLDYVSFVYAHGLEYCADNLMGATYADPVAAPPPHDWTREDAGFTDRPPLSTRAVLDLDLDGGDPPIEVGLADVPAELAGQLERVDWDRLGDWYVYLLLYPIRDQFPADALAAAWRADRALFLRDPASGATSVLWTSDWATEADADSVAAALWTLVGQNPIKGDPPNRALSDDGELVHIERRGTRLVMARNLAAETLDVLVDASFAGAAAAPPRRFPSLPAFVQRRRQRFDFAGF